MKSFVLFLAIFGWGAAMLTGTSSVKNPLTYANCEVSWKASTNNWPKFLWIYKVVPQNFSPSIISNLLAMSSFTPKDRVSQSGESAAQMKGAQYFRNADESKHLGVYPALGFIEYNNRTAKAVSQLQPVANVPSPDDATKLGLKYLALYGIDVSQLATKANKKDLDLHWEQQTIYFHERTNGEGRTLTNLCGVFFLRCIDGINFKGIGLNGGVEISFGNNSNIVDLQISWRNLERFKNARCFTPEKIMKQISEGKITLPPKVGNLDEIRKIKIISAIPLYDGAFGEEKQDFISPFLSLSAEVETSRRTNQISFSTKLIDSQP